MKIIGVLNFRIAGFGQNPTFPSLMFQVKVNLAKRYFSNFLDNLIQTLDLTKVIKMNQNVPQQN
jgi:hypothetical protein